MMKLVYVCSEDRVDLQKYLLSLQRYRKFVVNSKAVPIVSQLLFPQYIGKDSIASVKEVNKAMLRKCTELWVFGTVQTAKMRAEVKEALAQGLPVLYFTEDCVFIRQVTPSKC